MRHQGERREQGGLGAGLHQQRERENLVERGRLGYHAQHRQQPPFGAAPAEEPEQQQEPEWPEQVGPVRRARQRAEPFRDPWRVHREADRENGQAADYGLPPRVGGPEREAMGRLHGQDPSERGRERRGHQQRLPLDRDPAP